MTARFRKQKMAGLKKDMPHPESLTLHGQTRVLEIGFSDGAQFRIPFELMRVYSPSAEVQGHGPGQEVLQTGKREVGIAEIEPVGNYAVKPTFTDGHESGCSLGNTCTFWATKKRRSGSSTKTACKPRA
jgi:DUF971 family protein